VKFRGNLDAISRIIAPVKGKADPPFPYVRNSSLLKDTDRRIS
jgi:hypothetical protein